MIHAVPLINMEVSRRNQQLSVAIPASFTRDIPHLREKTARCGLVARAFGIFRVDKAIIYSDSNDQTTNKEGQLLEKLLSYQETPQHLRKTLFAHDPDLQFAGILPPLRLPNHPAVEEPRLGLIREAVVVHTGDPSKVDAGFKRLVTVDSRLPRFQRVTLRITKTHPELGGEIVDRSRLPIYWGFRVIRTDLTIGRLAVGEAQDLTISTSRVGRNIREELPALREKWNLSRKTIVLFGSPGEGVPEMLKREGLAVEDIADFNVNMIPDQGVETVRTEEALFPALSILNLLGEK